MCSSRVIPERILTAPTPGSAVNCFWMTFSARSCISASGSEPERTMVATPKALMSILLTDGASTSDGSRLRTPLTTRSTSTETRSVLAAVLNWTMTVETPDEEIEVKPLVSMFWSVAIASSIGLVTLASTVSGSAPG
jgi:hypothetical protein